jgi:hypothetical protein
MSQIVILVNERMNTTLLHNTQWEYLFVQEYVNSEFKRMSWKRPLSFVYAFFFFNETESFSVGFLS